MSAAAASGFGARFRSFRRFGPALVAALVLNAVLLASAALLSRDRALPQDLTEPVGVQLVSLKPPAPAEQERRVTPPPPKPKPKPDFQPELLRPAIGAPAPTGISVQLDPSLFAGGPARGDFIFNAADLDQPPVPVVQPSPFYSNRERARGIEGHVTIRFLVDADGSVSRISVVDSRPKDVFEDAVLKVAPRWKYRPGTIDGQPVPTWVEKTVRFTLNQ